MTISERKRALAAVQRQVRTLAKRVLRLTRDGVDVSAVAEVQGRGTTSRALVLVLAADLPDACVDQLTNLWGGWSQDLHVAQAKQELKRKGKR